MLPTLGLIRRSQVSPCCCVTFSIHLILQSKCNQGSRKNCVNLCFYSSNVRKCVTRSGFRLTAHTDSRRPAPNHCCGPGSIHPCRPGPAAAPPLLCLWARGTQTGFPSFLSSFGLCTQMSTPFLTFRVRLQERPQSQGKQLRAPEVSPDSSPLLLSLNLAASLSLSPPSNLVAAVELCCLTRAHTRSCVPKCLFCVGFRK